MVEVFRANQVSVPNARGGGLEQLDLSLYQGEVLALFGNRYSGKSLLFELLMGTVVPQSGTLRWMDAKDKTHPVVIRVREKSILIDELLVWENMTMMWKGGALLRPLHTRKQQTLVRLMLEDYEVGIDPCDRVSSLSPMQKAMLEILVARHQKASVLLLDLSGMEGTTQEYERLKQLLGKLKQEQISTIIYSHQVTICALLADRVAVLHQGRVIKTVNQTAHCRQELSRISRVLYREDDQRYQTKKHQGEPVLSITGLEAGLREPLSFGLNRGEFVVMVTPKVELFQILQCRVLEGEQEKNCILSYHGKAVRRLSRQRGVIFLDGTHLDDLIEELSPLENLCIGIYDKAGRFGLENRNIMRCMEQDFYDWYGHDGMLRGKNCRSLYRKDRVAINLFKLNFLNPQIIFCNDLSIHNDIINYHFVKETIAKLTERGTTVCMITGDLMYNDELVDRYVVLYDEYD